MALCRVSQQSSNVRVAAISGLKLLVDNALAQPLLKVRPLAV